MNGGQERQSRVTPSQIRAGHDPRDESGVMSQQTAVTEEQRPRGREEEEVWRGASSFYFRKRMLEINLGMPLKAKKSREEVQEDCSS